MTTGLDLAVSLFSSCKFFEIWRQIILPIRHLYENHPDRSRPRNLCRKWRLQILHRRFSSSPFWLIIYCCKAPIKGCILQEVDQTNDRYNIKLTSIITTISWPIFPVIWTTFSFQVYIRRNLHIRNDYQNFSQRFCYAQIFLSTEFLELVRFCCSCFRVSSSTTLKCHLRFMKRWLSGLRHRFHRPGVSSSSPCSSPCLFQADWPRNPWKKQSKGWLRPRSHVTAPYWSETKLSRSNRMTPFRFRTIRNGQVRTLSKDYTRLST